MTNSSSAWAPDWAVRPGDVLLEALQDRQMTQSELAHRMNRPIKTISEIVNGKAAVTTDTALQLERTLGISAEVWNNLELNFRQHEARLQEEIRLKDAASWVDRFPIKDLVKHGLIGTTSSKADTLSSLLSFLRVSSPDAWERHWLSTGALYRSSPTFAKSPEAVSAWLSWGEIKANAIDTEPFNADEFRRAVNSARDLTTREPFEIVLNKVKRLFAAAGVALVLTPEFKGTHLSGAARWLSSDKVMVQLSLRHKSDDHFWFTLFHECGHVLSRGRRRDYLDSGEQDDLSNEEQAANRFARDLLINPDAYDEFCSAGIFNTAVVRAFAKTQAVAPGIVVGRLQTDGWLERNALNSLKKSLTWI